MATHDYVIANQSGAAFRTDLNNALAAIVSNNSNSSEPATKYAYQWWADTSAGVLKIRNSANNGWIELLQLDGTLTLEDGSASTPALAFRDDLDTGIFSSAANTFDIATAGSKRLIVDSVGRVGIGNILPNSYNAFANTLVVATSTNTGLTLSGNDASANYSGIQFSAGTTVRAYVDQQLNSTGRMRVFNMANGFLEFGTNNAIRMHIKATGEIGIGTTTPDSIFDITSSTPLITLNSTVTNLGADNLVGAIKVFKSDASGSGAGVCGGLFWRSEDSFGARTYIQFTNRQNSTGQTNTDTECMRIDGSGVVTFFKLKLGSGNDHNSAKIVLQGSTNNDTTNAIFIKNSDETELFSLRNDGVFYTGVDGASPYNLTTSSAANMVVSSTGAVRRSTSSVRYKKDIADATFGLADVLKLKPKTFKSNATGEFADDKTHAGFTAEDIHDLGLTEFVHYNEDNEPDALAYGNMVALMAKAIQELNAKVAALEAA